MDSYATHWTSSGGGGPVIHAWHYEPRVDIDNDGSRRDVIVWTGRPVDENNRPCGSIPEAPRLTEPIRVQQLAFVLTKDGQDIDDARTLAVFGHPTGGRPSPEVHPRSAPFPYFIPIGGSLDIFQYRNETYFDTFFDGGGWPDFAGKRADMPSLKNHLVVFILHSGATRQVCEYLYRGTQAMKAEQGGNSYE